MNIISARKGIIMPKLSNLDKTLKNINKVANHATAISAVVGLVSTAAVFVIEMVDKREKKIDISAICSATGHPTTIGEAKEYLEKAEVKAVYIPIKVSEADPKYRDCFEFQVVDVTPSSKIVRGNIPQVYYVTREVIDKSQQLFEEAERQRIMTELEKQVKQSERKEKATQVAADVFDTAKQGVKKIPAVLRKKSKVEEEQE